ncbi:surface protein putative [Vibrio astriarenae]|nr:surface protein putative [Vibrio sp. C7]
MSVEITSAFLTEIIVSVQEPSIPKGASVALVAMATYNDGTSLDVSDSVTWSSDTNIALVTPEGLLTGVDIGSAVITAFKDNVTSNSINIEVTSAVVVELEILPTSVTLSLRENTRLSTTAIYSDGTRIQPDESIQWLSWTNNDPSVALVLDHSLIYTFDIGQATAFATFEGIKSETITINVIDSPLTEVYAIAESSYITSEREMQVSAIGVYANGDSRDITSQVTWSTDDPSIASITAEGVLRGS